MAVITLNGYKWASEEEAKADQEKVDVYVGLPEGSETVNYFGYFYNDGQEETGQFYFSVADGTMTEVLGEPYDFQIYSPM